MIIPYNSGRNGSLARAMSLCGKRLELETNNPPETALSGSKMTEVNCAKLR
jgi:hypothetical protein